MTLRLSWIPLLAIATTAAAMPPELTPQQVLDVCRSASIASAIEKGDGLGWQRAPEDPGWREIYEKFDKGSKVQAVRWQRGSDVKDGVLDFWVTQGAAAGRSCSFKAPRAPGLREALFAAFGKPRFDDASSIGTMTSWLQGGSMISYSTLKPTDGVSVTIDGL